MSDASGLCLRPLRLEEQGEGPAIPGAGQRPPPCRGASQVQPRVRREGICLAQAVACGSDLHLESAALWML